jgi:hypothetical protein
MVCKSPIPRPINIGFDHSHNATPAAQQIESCTRCLPMLLTSDVVQNSISAGADCVYWNVRLVASSQQEVRYESSTNMTLSKFGTSLGIPTKVEIVIGNPTFSFNKLRNCFHNISIFVVDVFQKL